MRGSFICSASTITARDRMKRVIPFSFGLAIILSFETAAAGPPPRLQPGFWKPLVTAGAKWSLSDRSTPNRKLMIETYDVRKVGPADVARLRWSIVSDDNSWEADNIRTSTPYQIAITRAGAWFLSKDADDRAVASALRKRPNYSDPPHLVKQGTRKDGMYVEHSRSGEKWMLCLNYFPPPSAGDCLEGVCSGKLCIAQGRVVYVDGSFSPDEDIWAAEGYKRE